MNRRRAFTLIELMVTVAVVGVVSALGMFSMVELVAAERARGEAVRFASEMRRYRAEAMQQQMYSLVDVQPAAGGGVSVSYRARRFAPDGTPPCELLASGDAESTSSSTFKYIDIGVSTSATSAPAPICLDTFGRPFLRDNVTPAPAEFAVSHDTKPTLTVSIDALGAMASSDQPVANGVAQTSYYPMDLMVAESAPVPPNLAETVELPVYEVAPGEFVDAAGDPSDASLGGGDDPCLYDSAYCDPCVIDPMACDPCYADPYACGGYAY